MSIIRSYFKKNNTLIEGNLSNNSQNPVTEISYGTYNSLKTRYIFDVDLDLLEKRINDGLINPNNILKHTLKMTNTISYAPQYLGKKSYSDFIDRASSFSLDLFNITEDWDEGSGYDFIYDNIIFPTIKEQASNWYERKTNESWLGDGAYLSGQTNIIKTQRFEKGNENIEIDITDYINNRLNINGTGNTYSGSSYGLGIKFPDEIEMLETEFRKAVAFHARKTNTWYEPYIETTIDDTIIDDRNYFYTDKDNDLYLQMNSNIQTQDIIVDRVNIYDYQDNLIDTLSGDSIIKVSNGIYKITLNISSDTHPDNVIFNDEWVMLINGKITKYVDDFYLISNNNHFNFNNNVDNNINFDNYFFSFTGINEGEKITDKNIRKVKILIKELYPNQNKFIPLDIEYRLFTTIAKNHEVDVIPFTQVNRTNTGYYFNLDTSWLIPQDYKLQIRMKNENYYRTKETLSFTISSNKLFK